MIPQGVQVFVALDAVDMRSSFDRLSGIAKEQIGYEGSLRFAFVFYGRRRDALEDLVLRRQRHVRHFLQEARPRRLSSPEAMTEGAHHVEIDDATLDALLDGIEVEAEPALDARAARPRVH